MLKKISIIAGTFLLALVVVQQANAAVLENAYVSLSNSLGGQTGVTHTYRFTTVGTDLGSIGFEYCTTASGTCTDTGATFEGSVSFSSVVGPTGYGTDAANWSVLSHAEPLLEIQRSSAISDGNGLWTFAIQNIQNPAYATCGGTTTGTSDTQGTCYVRITTYNDTNTTTAVDNTVVSLTVTQNITVKATVDPSFTMTIAQVAGNTAIGGITTTTGVTTTVTSIPFGNLTPGTPKYAAHQITISTNASQGYSVVARMASSNMTGTAYGHDIDPFDGGAADTNVSAAWSSPTGTASGTDSGWLGVGTSDAGAPGYVINQFYPLNTTGQTVISNNTSANNDANYVLYGIEVNNYQRADSYEGIMRFNALPVY